MADDLFWYHAPRSLALARELRRRGIRKQWMLVQSRVDLVARHAELLEAWRPLAKDFDIFFGLEAATNEGLDGLKKDATVDETARGRRGCALAGVWCHRQLRHRPRVARRGLREVVGVRRAPPVVSGGVHDSHAAAGNVVLRRDARPRAVTSWAHFDMHHLLWEPALGPERFFELYCETWRRSVLNLKGRKSLWRWLREVDPRNMLFLVSALRRTQRMMAPEHYISEYDLPRL